MIRRTPGSNESDSEKKPAITYWAKEQVRCPVCKKPFNQEVMHKGGGRMIAGNLTEELHRNFEPSKRFGRVYPLIYDIGCCPKCHTAFFWKDFVDIKDADRLILDASADPALYASGYLSSGKLVSVLHADTNLMDGVYDAEVVTEAVRPLSLLLGND